MSYLLIKQNDVKTFKSFLSGHEIEVGVLVDSKTDIFGTGEEIEIFYGNEVENTYKAEITRKHKYAENAEQALLKLALVKR